MDINLFTLLSFLSAAIYLYLGLSTWRKEPGSRLTQVFFLQCLSLAVWAYFYAFVYQAPNKEILWFWFKLSALGWCTLGGITLHFFMVLCGKEKVLKKGWVYIPLYLPGLILIYKAWTGFVTVKDFIPGPLGWVGVPALDSFWYWIHIVNLLDCVLISLYLFWQRGKTSNLAREKAQTRLILTTAASVVVLGFVVNMILPAFNFKVLPAIAPILLLLWAKAVWESMMKYRLMAPSPKVAGEEIITRMKDVMILINTSGGINQVNPQVENLLGYREEELRGKGLETIIPDPGLVAALEDSLKKNLTIFPDLEAVMKTREGEMLPFLISSSIIRDDFNDPIGLVLVGHDLRQTKALQSEIVFREKAEQELIKGRELLEWQVQERTKELAQTNKKLEEEINEHKLSEESLRRSEERYRDILSSIEDGYFEVDLNGTLIFSNEANERIFGYKPGELIGMNYRVYTDQENAEKVFAIFNKVYLTGVPDKGFVWEVVKRNGEKAYVDTSVSLILDSNQEKVGFRGILRDITRQKQTEEALKALSLIDDLTGLYNRRGFLALAEQELKVARRLERVIFLLFADLDEMKAINDTFGHLEGDRALIEIAHILKENFRDPDIIARIGGDEFVILAIEGTSEAGPELLRERLRENLDRHNNKEPDRKYRLSLTIGAVVYDPENPVSIDTLLFQADRNMYEEKARKKKDTQLRLEF